MGVGLVCSEVDSLLGLGRKIVVCKIPCLRSATSALEQDYCI